jgi:hypothetical protein
VDDINMHDTNLMMMQTHLMHISHCR